MGYKISFWGVGNISYLDLDGGYIHVCTYVYVHICVHINVYSILVFMLKIRVINNFCI